MSVIPSDIERPVVELNSADHDRSGAGATGRWQLGPARRDLPVNEVDVWLTDLDLGAESIGQLRRSLSDEERDIAAKFHFAVDRGRYIAAHGFLRAVLSRYLPLAPADIAYAPDSYGKPGLRGSSAASNLSFNLAHSQALAACALAVNRAVGVDIERCQFIEDLETVARHTFAPAEYAALLVLPEARRQRAFYACWTRKEAYVKAVGRGLSLSLKTFTVTVDPDAAPRLNAAEPDLGSQRWTITNLNISEDFVGALVVDGCTTHYNYWRWRFPQEL